jgi:simple sugar transport system permease protein
MTAVAGEPTAAPGRKPVRGRPRIPPWARLAIIIAVGVGILSLTATLTGQLQLTSRGTTQAAVLLLLPILFAGLGGLWAERAGVINIGLEGMMILGTWGAAWAGYQWGPWAAVVGGLVFGALGGVLHAVATVTFGVNHIVSGVAITLLGAGVTQYLSSVVFLPVSHNPARVAARCPGFDTFSVQPLADGLAAVEDEQRVLLSDVAGLLGGLIGGLTPLVVLGFALVPDQLPGALADPVRAAAALLRGEPGGCRVARVDVYRYKYLALLASGRARRARRARRSR